MNYKKIMILLAASQLLLIIDTAIINVIVVTISRELNFTPESQSWIANAYLIAFGGALLVAGRFADLIGRVRAFQIGLIVLATGSVLAALATDPTMLISGRAFQGLGAALSAAASLAMILATFQGEQRQSALGLLAAMAGLGGAIGTFLGGALTEWFGWRSTFWINVVAALLLLVLSISALRELKGQRLFQRIDLAGAILLIAGQTLLALGILGLGEQAFSRATVAGILLVAVLVLVGFLWLEKRIKHALIPAITWKNRGLIGAATILALGQIVIFPMFFLANLYLQNVLYYSPFESGLAFLPLCAIVVVTANNIRHVIGRLGLMGALSFGFAMVAIGLGWLATAQVDGSFVVSVLGPTLFVGVGLPIIGIVCNILGGQHTSVGEEGLTSGLLNTAQQFGSVIGLSMFVSIAAAYTANMEASVGNTLGGYQVTFGIGSVISALAAFLLLIRRQILRSPR